MNTLENNRKQAEAAALKKTRTVAAGEVLRVETWGGGGGGGAGGGVNTIEGGFPRPEAWFTWRAGTVPVGESVMAAPPLKVVAEYELSDGRVLTVYLNGSTKISGAPQS
jgi:hypothetical protein